MITYIIHVSDDYERKEHMNSQLEGKDLDVEFILEGDKKDLSEEVLSAYFTGWRKNVSNSTSCVYKHILAYEKIVENNDDYALILEDDIVFYRGFSEYLQKFINEIKTDGLHNYIVSLEDSMLVYVKRSERIHNKYLYPKDRGRYAGAYLIDYAAANNILQLIKNEKCSIPMDWYHDECAKNEVLNIYWSQPTIAVQNSHTGSMATLLDGKTSGTFRILSFYIQKTYKRIRSNLQ